MHPRMQPPSREKRIISHSKYGLNLEVICWYSEPNHSNFEAIDSCMYIRADSVSNSAHAVMIDVLQNVQFYCAGDHRVLLVNRVWNSLLLFFKHLERHVYTFYNV